MVAKRALRNPAARQPVQGTPAPAPSPLELDRVIHERVRLGIVAALAANDALTFNDLKNLLELTDGNLSVHARRLEEVGYIVCTKGFEGRVPKTEYKITASGRRAFDKYLRHMESLIQTMRNPGV